MGKGWKPQTDGNIHGTRTWWRCPDCANPPSIFIGWGDVFGVRDGRMVVAVAGEQGHVQVTATSKREPGFLTESVRR